jgi:hypothetical protein
VCFRAREGGGVREAPEAVDERAMVLSVFQHSAEGFAQRRRRERQP